MTQDQGGQQQNDVVIYTTPWCPYCTRAKKLLRQKGIEFEEINVAFDHGLRNQMVERSGRTTVPQIFIKENGIGGCDDLYALEAAGKLDPMLA